MWWSTAGATDSPCAGRRWRRAHAGGGRGWGSGALAAASSRSTDASAGTPLVWQGEKETDGEGPLREDSCRARPAFLLMTNSHQAHTQSQKRSTMAWGTSFGRRGPSSSLFPFFRLRLPFIAHVWTDAFATSVCILATWAVVPSPRLRTLGCATHGLMLSETPAPWKRLLLGLSSKTRRRGHVLFTMYRRTIFWPLFEAVLKANLIS